VTSKSKLLFTILVVLAIGGRAASFGAALSQHRRRDNSSAGNSARSVPQRVYFREVAGRGLLVQTWVNGIGPFNFAIDTGAGSTLISARVADEARVSVGNGRSTSIAGLSGTKVAAHKATLESLAIGDSENYLPAHGKAMITGGLPNDLDGVLDPTEALSPLGYVIDLPQHELVAFDPQNDPVQMNRPPAEGTVVQWLREAHGRRPFVQLDNGDRALLDTGSSLGLAIRDTEAGDGKHAAYAVRDVGGGRISTRRVTTTNIAIGSLTLRRIPTDLVSGAEADAPVLLGLAALRPFRLRFDPLHRLIEIAPAVIPQRTK